MSVYTTQLRFICENEAGLNNSSSDFKSIISSTATKILGDFPIFDENYREVLCNKIVTHYYTREIGYETVALWKFKINARLNEIMPYYNKLYETELLKFNPLYDIEMNRTHSSSISGITDNQNNSNGATTNVGERSGSTIQNNSENGSNNSRSENDYSNKYSDTPQGSVSFSEENDNEYLTNFTKIGENRTDVNSHSSTSKIATDNKSTDTNTSSLSSKSNSTTSVSNIEQYTERVFGKSNFHTFSKLLTEFRATFINIDLLIIDELSDLFFGIYDFYL